SLVDHRARGFPGAISWNFCESHESVCDRVPFPVTSSAGNSICSFETEPGWFSTATFMRAHATLDAFVGQPLRLPAGDAPALQFQSGFATDVNGMYLSDSKPVRQLPIIFAIEDCKVRNLARLKRANLIAAIETVSGVDR